MNKWEELADKQTIQKTIDALKANGINASFVATGAEAKGKVLELIPNGAQVFTMTSQTLETIGLAKEINESGRFDSVRNKLYAMDRVTQGVQIRRLGAAPDWAVGSVQAVAEDGSVLIASNSGSQLPAYAYGSGQVIWVVGAQKIVKNIDEGIKRIFEHSFPLENERAKKAYGISSGVSKILIVNKEKVPNRISMIIVCEKLGF